jgi:hypothetical protein
MEHVVTRMNDHYYVCEVCGQAGSGRWALLHQYPTASIVAEGPITPGPGSEALQDAVERALGIVTD